MFPPGRLPLVRFVVVRSVDMRRTRGHHRIRRSRAVLTNFWRHSRFVFLRRPPRPCEHGFILPSTSRPFRVLPLRARPRPPGQERLPWGCVSLFATSAARVVVPGFQARHLSVLGVSHALDGLIRGRPCRFISPRSHVQGSPFRVFPPRTAAPIRHRHVPSRRLATVDYCGCPQRHLLPPRPQGFTLSEGPLPAHQFYPLRRPDPLLGFSSSRCSLSKPRKNE
jgi:hypothetical protein